VSKQAAGFLLKLSPCSRPFVMAIQFLSGVRQRGAR